MTATVSTSRSSKGAGDGEPELGPGPRGQDADGGREQDGVDGPLVGTPGHAAPQPVPRLKRLRPGVELGPDPPK
jgi:hypothetical protein